MLKVDLEQAKRDIEELLRKAEEGEDILILGAERPVARLTAAADKARRKQDAIRQLRTFADGRCLGDLSIKALREEGRR